MKLNIKAMALTSGLLWGFGIFVLTWWVIIFDGSTGDPTLIGQVYRGFTISPIGSFIGLVWGFFDGALAGGIFAWLYNFISSRIY